MDASTVTATSVFDFQSERQEKSTVRPGMRSEKRSSVSLRVGEVFNPFQLFIGAMIPSAVLRNPDLSPSAKLVFARLAQFAGRQGKAWPSDLTLGREVGLGDRQARRCVAELERYGLIRRVSRAGHSNLFEFLWHPIYEEGRTEMTGLPPTEQGQDRQALPPVVPAQNGKEAARDAVGTVSKTAEPVHQEKGPASDPQHYQTRLIPELSTPAHTAMQGDKSVDPEQIFLSRLRQRHGIAITAPAIVQCIAGELKSWKDWDDFLAFDERQTTAPELLKNPPGHYRQLVHKFYAARAQKRDWQRQQQQLALELRIEIQAQAKQPKPVCPLSQCNGWGEWWNEQGRVVACSCEHGQKLSAKVLEAFEQLNAKLQAEAPPLLAKRPPGSERMNLSPQDLAKSKIMPLGLSSTREAVCG